MNKERRCDKGAEAWKREAKSDNAEPKDKHNDIKSKSGLHFSSAHQFIFPGCNEQWTPHSAEKTVQILSVVRMRGL